MKYIYLNSLYSNSRLVSQVNKKYKHTYSGNAAPPLAFLKSTKLYLLFEIAKLSLYRFRCLSYWPLFTLTRSFELPYMSVIHERLHISTPLALFPIAYGFKST